MTFVCIISILLGELRHQRKNTQCKACHGTGRITTGHLDPVRLAILADALEEAGCNSIDILAHLRSPGPHVRGCWALDLILGKE